MPGGSMPTIAAAGSRRLPLVHSLSSPLPLLLMTASKTVSKTAQVRQFIGAAGSTIVSVTFRKVDGTLRTLQFNPRDRQEIKGTGTATRPPEIVCCRDLRIARRQGQGAWRSFNAERVVIIRAKGKELAL